MKIALLTGEYPPMQGGVGAFTQALAQELDVLGHDLYIVTSRKARPTLTSGSASLRLRLDDPIDIGYAKLLPLTRRWKWRDSNLVADLAVRYDFDLVNIQYQAAAYNMRRPAINLLPWRLRGITKSVVTFHDLRVPYLFPKAGKLRHHLIKRMAHNADGVIVTNHPDYDTLNPVQPHLAQIPIGSNIPIHPISHDEKQQTRAQLGLTDGDQLLGYFGFLNASKGADQLIEAAAELRQRGRPVHVVFIGGQTGASDPNNNHAFLQTIKQQVTQYELDRFVHWTGFVDDRDVSRYLCAADLIVFPYQDGASLRRGTLMAALAHRCPIVTTMPQDARSPLKHGENVWLVDDDNKVDHDEGMGVFSAAIDHLLRDQPSREQLANGAEKLSKQFTWLKIAQQTSKFYQEIA